MVCSFTRQRISFSPMPDPRSWGWLHTACFLGPVSLWRGWHRTVQGKGMLHSLLTGLQPSTAWGHLCSWGFRGSMALLGDPMKRWKGEASQSHLKFKMLPQQCHRSGWWMPVVLWSLHPGHVINRELSRYLLPLPDHAAPSAQVCLAPGCSHDGAWRNVLLATGSFTAGSLVAARDRGVPRGQEQDLIIVNFFYKACF